LNCIFRLFRTTGDAPPRHLAGHARILSG